LARRLVISGKGSKGSTQSSSTFPCPDVILRAKARSKREGDREAMASRNLSASKRAPITACVNGAQSGYDDDLGGFGSRDPCVALLPRLTIYHPIDRLLVTFRLSASSGESSHRSQLTLAPSWRRLNSRFPPSATLLAPHADYTLDPLLSVRVLCTMGQVASGGARPTDPRSREACPLEKSMKSASRRTRVHPATPNYPIA